MTPRGSESVSHSVSLAQKGWMPDGTMGAVPVTTDSRIR